MEIKHNMSVTYLYNLHSNLDKTNFYMSWTWWNYLRNQILGYRPIQVLKLFVLLFSL